MRSGVVVRKKDGRDNKPILIRMMGNVGQQFILPVFFVYVLV